MAHTALLASEQPDLMKPKDNKTQRHYFDEHYIPEPMSGCWLWLRKTDRDGYGRMWTGSEEIGAHRWAYVNAYGPLDPLLKVLHYCDTPSCVNPAHLFAGTQKTNALDMKAKGRHSSGDRRLSAQLREQILNSPFARNATAKMFGVNTKTVQFIWRRRIKADAGSTGSTTCPSSPNEV